MPHWKAILTYDGTPYNGWQVQPNQPTIQGTLAQAIHRITGETVLPQGSGRTDTGVHALGQVATFPLNVPIPAANLHHALNRALPSSIRVLSLETVPADFHARHSALRKTYEYRIFPGSRICSPMLAPFLWAYPFDLLLSTLQQAAAHILGIHDFTSFAASDPDLATRNKTNEDDSQPASFDAANFAQLNSDLVNDAEAESPKASNSLQPAPSPSSSLPTHATNVRTIYHSAWLQQNDLLIYRITGSGFLHHMVRNLVGTFVEVGTGSIPADDLPTILAARNRSAAGPTAPARGLFLIEVVY
jgi:tRNA pseudouridine38-40 synthase